VGKLELSKKENEFIYHEKIPDLDTLQEIKGASLVSRETLNQCSGSMTFWCGSRSGSADPFL
jgi:tyrosine-protein phosphatase non-receptor type 23